MLTLKSVLLVFRHIFGLKVNLDKSNTYGINLEQNHLSKLAELLDCKASGWPILYLGLPLGGNPKACGFWDPVIERISRRLDGWRKTYLSFGGRITLIQSCLTYMPCYLPYPRTFYSQIFLSCLISIFWFASSFPYYVCLEFLSPFQSQVLCLVSGTQEGKY